MKVRVPISILMVTLNAFISMYTLDSNEKRKKEKT